jgi:hypothetical protein
VFVVGDTEKVVGDPATPLLVVTRVELAEQELVELSYSFTVKVDVPAVQATVRVILWPLSIFGEVGEMVGVVRAGLTVRVSPDEQTAFESESVTL